MIILPVGKNVFTSVLITLLVFNGAMSYAAFPVQAEAPVVSAEPHPAFKEKVQKAAHRYRPPAPIRMQGERSEGGWIGITALSLGIAGMGLLIAGFMSVYVGELILLGIAAAILAIIFGAIGLKKKNGGMSMAGMILGIAEITGLMLLIVIAMAMFAY